MSWLRLDDCHYLHRPRIDDHDFIPDHGIFKAAPGRFDFHNGPRKSGEPHGTWHPGAHRSVEVGATHPRSVSLLDDNLVYSGALLRCEIDGGSRPSRTLASGRPILLGPVNSLSFP